jgi:5,10-methenyltetrahydrofolate synthetase
MIRPMQTRAQTLAWRKAQRERLIASRLAMPVESRQRASAGIVAHMDRFCRQRGWLPRGTTVSAWWPLRGEPDLRPWLGRMHTEGLVAALPLVVEKAAPLRFRAWYPGCRMERGFWDIPQPADPMEVEPDLFIAPGVGYDGAGYRLGYGGGYFDRTLAKRLASGRPFHAVLVAYAMAGLETIHPLPHDIGFEAVITEQGPMAGGAR